MFDIRHNESGHIKLSGRFDASRADEVRNFLDTVTESCTLDFKDLEYISSAGLGVLLGKQKRLSESSHSLKIINLNKHIKEIFIVAGFDLVFDIE
ncbi:MAG: STAS domain-containing protein [Candidatus Krumholzibacteria bacterium]|nr:STAS domain-containing protein [Candidatus Krumholzibacteria bacterium]